MNQDWQARRQERWARRQERWEGGYGGPKPLSGMLLGLILIGGGLLFLLRNLGIVYFDNLWDFWPLILIVMGVSRLVSPRNRRDISSGVILGGIGALFLLRNLGFIYGSVWSFIWPGIFIAIGISMLLRNMYGPDWWGGGGSPAAGLGPGLHDSSSSSTDLLQIDVIFGGVDRKVLSQAFVGGRVAVLFGGAEIDLRGAAIQRPEVVIHADAVFGGVELIVPDTWVVDVRGSGVFGGYEDRTHRPGPLAGAEPPKLVVQGSALFGGVTVRN